MELRTIVTREDTLDIIKLVQESIFEACHIDMGMNNRPQMQGGFSSNQ